MAVGPRRAWLAAICAALLFGCGGGDPEPTPPAPVRVEEQLVHDDGSTGLARPKFIAGRCRIYTNEPGWSVFVDGYPVRDAAGEILKTPCVVEALATSHAVTVAWDGRLDQSRQVLFAQDAEVVFDTANVPAGESLLLKAPYIGIPVGRAIPLNSLNTGGKEFDPFLSPDGRGIVFAADRPEGRGIYTATRLSPLHPFDTPTLLRLTSSVDQAASPSINGEATMVVYTLPAKGRIRALTRSSPLADYAAPEVLLSDDDLDARYPSAQILASGDRIYFARETEGITETRVAFPTPDKQLPFGNVRIVQFVGEHPRLSTDGLRQYLFDGRSLRRSRRTAVNLSFEGTEKIIDLDIPEFRLSSGHRQFCVSDDEQWMIFCDDPVGGGDLWMVRLSNGPGWGVPHSGSTIEARMIAAATPAMQPGEELFTPPAVDNDPQPPPDPRTQPLAYVAFRQQLATAAAERNFAQALDLVEQAQTDPTLAAVQQLIEWDRLDVQQLMTFWEDVQRGAQLLRPGDKVRFGSLSVDFEKLTDGVITAKARTKSVEKRLEELDAAALVTLAEPVLDPANPAEMLRPAVFLTYASDDSSSRLPKFLADSGPLGIEFVERLAGREAALVQLELERENISAALRRIELLEAEYPGSKAATGADALRENLYARTNWRRVGGRNWQLGPSGEYTADADRVEGAILQSPTELGDFSLSLEYRTNLPSGQGGVYLTYTGQGRLDRNALKVQLSNDSGIRPDPYCTGALFSLEAPVENAARPQGEWNTLVVSLRGDRLVVTLNGKQVLKTKIDTGSRPVAGFVALDGISGGISYRKMILSDQPAVP